MSPADQKKRFRAFAKQLQDGIAPSPRQIEDLIYIFDGLARGRDPMRLLELNYSDGKSEKAERARIKMDLVLHWISGATEKTKGINGKKAKPAHTKTRAFEIASMLAKTLFADDPHSANYDAAYIKKIWYEKLKAHKANPIRRPSDPDSIFEYAIPKSK